MREQYTVKNDYIKQPWWMHGWYSGGIVSIMWSSDVHLYLLQLVGMLEQYTVKNDYIKQPWWMHGYSGIDSIMHTSWHSLWWRWHHYMLALYRRLRCHGERLCQRWCRLVCCERVRQLLLRVKIKLHCRRNDGS